MLSRLVILQIKQASLPYTFRYLSDKGITPPITAIPAAKGVVQPQVPKTKPGTKAEDVKKMDVKAVDVGRSIDKLPSVQKIVSEKDLKDMGLPDVESAKVATTCERPKDVQPDSIKFKLPDPCAAVGGSKGTASGSSGGSTTPPGSYESRYSECEQKLRLQKFIRTSTFIGKLIRNDSESWNVVKSVRGNDVLNWIQTVYQRTFDVVQRYFTSQQWAFTKECFICSLILSHKLFVKKVPEWFNELRQSNLFKSMEKKAVDATKSAAKKVEGKK